MDVRLTWKYTRRQEHIHRRVYMIRHSAWDHLLPTNNDSTKWWYFRITCIIRQTSSLSKSIPWKLIVTTSRHLKSQNRSSWVWSPCFYPLLIRAATNLIYKWSFCSRLHTPNFSIIHSEPFSFATQNVELSARFISRPFQSVYLWAKLETSPLCQNILK
jgi:hypothetical protein